MRLLILGGTRFVGRHLVDAALAHGHDITLFNRGKTNEGLFPQVTHIQGDRNTGLAGLRGKSWEAVIDTCGYLPRAVRDSASELADRAGHYTFISSISVYDDFSQAGLNEDSPLQVLEDPATEDIPKHYGALKVACEQEVLKHFRNRALIVRPGYIVGPHDSTDRFTWWVRAASQGGEMTAPAPEDAPLQVIDARDLAAWMLDATERHLPAVLQATSPNPGHTFGGLIETVRQVSGADTRVRWVDIAAEPETAQARFPLWVPPVGDAAGVHRVDVSRAVADGLRFRPLADTVRDTLEWDRARGAPPMAFG